MIRVTRLKKLVIRLNFKMFDWKSTEKIFESSISEKKLSTEVQLNNETEQSYIVT